MIYFLPSAGGYVLDNFPRTREQFTSMIERNIIPDEVICLKDDSENGEFLLKRWYQTNKEGENNVECWSLCYLVVDIVALNAEFLASCWPV